MYNNTKKVSRRIRRKKGIRKRIAGTSEVPRLTVYRSAKHIYAQIIDDSQGVTLAQASSRAKDLSDDLKNGSNIEAAKRIGKDLAAKAKAKNIEKLCFDRNGYKYHGRIKGLADALREEGITI